MKKILIITALILASFFSNAQSPKDRIATNSATWFCADDFGMVNDSTTDNTTALQNLINYIATIKKNSVIYFSKPGIYYFNGAMQDTLVDNAMIRFPDVAITDTQYTITLKGYIRPTFSPSVYSYTPMPSATILRCGNSVGANGGGKFFGGGGDSVSFVVPGFENIIIQTVPNPIITAVDFSYFTCTFIKDVVIMAGYNQDAFNVIQPTHINSFGFKQPLVSSGINQRIEGVLNVMGFYNGARIGEGAMIDDIGLWACRNGLVYGFSYGYSEIGRAIIGWCPYGIKIDSFHNIIIRAISNEHYNVDTTKWFRYVKDLVDTTNTAIGHIEWATVEANVGVIHSFNKYLGDSIYTHELGHFISDTVDRWKWRDTTGGIYLPTIRGNVGLGTITPLYVLHIKKDQDNPTYSTIQNSTSGSLALAGNLFLSDGGASVIANNSTQLATAGGAQVANSLAMNTNLKNGISINSLDANGNIRFAVGGVLEKMRLHANGTLSIGQLLDSASAKLIVANSIMSDSLIGKSTSGGNLRLQSTTHATKGNILFGTSVYDEANNKLGIGITPVNLLDVYSNTNGASTMRFQNANTGSSAFAGVQIQNNTGSCYIYMPVASGYSTSSLSNTLVIQNANSGDIVLHGAAEAVRITSAGSVKFNAYGAGTATFDASGNITSVSDERLKTDIQYYKSGLKELMKLKPIQYKWNKLSGNETKETYAGFSAQNVKENIKFGTGENKDGFLSLQDRAIMATLVNAVQEQQKQIEELKEEIKKLKK